MSEIRKLDSAFIILNQRGYKKGFPQIFADLKSRMGICIKKLSSFRLKLTDSSSVA